MSEDDWWMSTRDSRGSTGVEARGPRPHPEWTPPRGLWLAGGGMGQPRGGVCGRATVGLRERDSAVVVVVFFFLSFPFLSFF